MATADQKKLLALDGGGIMGLISLGILKKVEGDLRAAHNDPGLKLRDFFDYFAGTSTGAIIAAALAIGKSVDEVLAFYIESGEEMFDRASLFKRWRYSYDAANLREKLQAEFTDRSIIELQESGVLPTEKHLLIVTRNVNTDSPWPISTNPAAMFNRKGDPQNNRLLPLWQVVRASTAAPTFFVPEKLSLADGKEFYFEDGGVTPYNNPAFLVYKMATLPEYACRWPVGEDKMMLVSVGTGSAFRTLEDPNPRGEGLLSTAKTVPSELMRGYAVENDINCRTVGRCVHGAPLDLEIGTMMHGHDPKRPKAFLYARYDANVSQNGLDALGVGDIDASKLAMDNAAMVDELVQIGKAASEQVDIAARFEPFMPQSAASTPQ